MYEFKHWKEAFVFIAKTEGQEKQILKIENKMDTIYLREAARRYVMKEGSAALTFDFSHDLTEFTFKFNTDHRIKVPVYQNGLRDKIKSLQLGESIEIPDTEANIAAIRAVAYGSGYSVIKTETGCIVKMKANIKTAKSEVKVALSKLQDIGQFYEIPCEKELLNSVRVYVSQYKDPESKYNVILIADKARITKTK